MNKDNVVELIYATIPYADQITNLNTAEDNAIRFTWRGDNFRVTLDLHVTEIDGSAVTSNNISILLECLLRTKNE